MDAKILEVGNMINLCITSCSLILTYVSIHPGREDHCSEASPVQRKMSTVLCVINMSLALE